MIIPTSLLLLAYAAVTVSAHGKVAKVTGANGAVANGLAIVPSTPNTGTTKEIEADTTIFGARANRDVSTLTGCGKTQGGGVTDCQSAAEESIATSGGVVPTANADGTVDLTFHQVNQDGAGPLAAMVSTDMGQTWTAATISGSNVKGFAGLSLAKNVDVPVKVQIPAGTQCGGTVAGQSGVCLVGLSNPVQGFGGSVPVSMGTAATSKRSIGDDETPLLEARDVEAAQADVKVRRSHPRDFKLGQ